MDKMEMLRNYEATSAADAYIIGFAIAGRVYVAKVAPGRDIYVLTAWQFIAAGLLSFALSAATEAIRRTIARG